MNWEITIQVIAQVVAGLFIPFVLQHLWNWFAVPAFNLHEILYWQMFGIFLFARVLLFQGDDPKTDYRWQKTLDLLAFSVLKENQEKAVDRIKELNDQSWRAGLQKPFTEALLGACALVLGWIVHFFLTR